MPCFHAAGIAVVAARDMGFESEGWSGGEED